MSEGRRWREYGKGRETEVSVACKEQKISNVRKQEIRVGSPKRKKQTNELKSRYLLRCRDFWICPYVKISASYPVQPR